MHNDRSCLDVTPQDLGVLESWSLAGPKQPWHHTSSGCLTKWCKRTFEGFLEALKVVDWMQWLLKTWVANVPWKTTDLHVRMVHEVYCRNILEISAAEAVDGKMNRNWQLAMKMVFTVIILSYSCFTMSSDNKLKRTLMIDSGDKSCQSTNSPDLNIAE